jgi:TolA-binding protein
MAETYVKEFEKVTSSVDRLQADQENQARKMEKKMAERHERMQQKMEERQKEMQKRIADAQAGMQDLLVQAINPLMGKVNAVQVQKEKEISAVKEDFKTLNVQVEEGFKMLSAVVISQVARGEKEGGVPPNPLKQGEEGAVSSPQIPQVRGEGGASSPLSSP